MQLLQRVGHHRMYRRSVPAIATTIQIRLELAESSTEAALATHA